MTQASPNVLPGDLTVNSPFKIVTVGRSYRGRWAG